MQNIAFKGQHRPVALATRLGFIVAGIWLIGNAPHMAQNGLLAADGADDAGRPVSAGGKVARRTRVSIVRDRWHINGQITYPGAKAEGLLMNVRMVNSVFEDTQRPEFDAEANADEFIRQIPDYAKHGIRGVTLCLQGGMPGYEGAVNSAFAADGSLRESYLKRVQRVIEACDRNGVVVILGCYYQRQDQILKDEQAVRAGVVNVVNWITTNGFRNVVLEIANEFGHNGFDHPILRTPDGQVELIRLAKQTAPGLLVSTSGLGGGRLHEKARQAADFLLIHLNNTSLEKFATVWPELKKSGKPIVCNEDTKIGVEGARIAEYCVEHGISWGLMLQEHNQHFPFHFDGAADDRVVYDKLKELTSSDRQTSVIPDEYFPPPDATGGWRTLADREQIRSVTGIDADKLDEAFASIQGSTKNGGLLVVRRGWLVYERYFGLGHREATPNLASCGKSFTSIAVGILIHERPDLFPDGLDQQIFTPKYFPPEAFPQTDPRKQEIKLGQLLAFSAGIRGNNPSYVEGKETTISPAGPDGSSAMIDAVALGLKDAPESRGGRISAATLWCDPGEGYSYATSSIHLASIMLRHVTGAEMQEYVEKHVAVPLGWGRWGFGYKNAKAVTHTPGGGGIALRATDMLRFGYLLLRDGRWNDKQIVPADYVRHASRQSPYNRHFPYSLQFNVNTNGDIATHAARRVLEIRLRRTCAVCRSVTRSGRLETRRPRRAVFRKRHGPAGSPRRGAECRPA
jgi:CubicO group peptidase (beta-lactamase class C family)